ncbi:hypothetical protein EIN_087200 [Entamoeba invadens IP1]|uniref:hypothetical protein n=1 Tax=Entamoeba invadens IP1 TaxID=370355 RepID=UPI0002C3D671|nr:hypothetical protein EIN_087200 [Entamoeba invadens IP1]ELP85418.1 hypothetical protein EIN_087200 [Entamoeba invadens IP1]|eukprot:XP_004184764.1 hypothetical protein EIN_087200 [Entamoeba invadens IP1]
MSKEDESIKNELLLHFELIGRIELHPSISNRPFPSLAKSLIENYTFPQFKFPEDSVHQFVKSNDIICSTTLIECIDVVLDPKPLVKSQTMIYCSAPDVHQIVLSPSYYFEVTFEHAPNSVIRNPNDSSFQDDESGVMNVVAVGLASSGYIPGQMLGWNKKSIGLHSDDGNLFKDGDNETVCGATTYGETLGCGYTPKTHTAFFTRCGKLVKETEVSFTDVHLALSINSVDAFRVNIGKSPFVFDLFDYINKKK